MAAGSPCRPVRALVSSGLSASAHSVEPVPGPLWQGLRGLGLPPCCPLTPPWLWAQVLVLELSDVPSEQVVGVASVDLLQDREGFTWKGHERLIPRAGPLPWPAGFQPRVLVQCLPPAAVTAVTLHAEWGLVAFGTSHGFGLFDYRRLSPVLARCVRAGGDPCTPREVRQEGPGPSSRSPRPAPRCTLHPSDSLAMEGPLSRVKSLKKSLRQSFRRIRKSRVSGKKRAVAAGSKVGRAAGGQEGAAAARPRSGPHAPPVAGGQRTAGGAGRPPRRGGDARAAPYRAPLGRRLPLGRRALPVLRRHLPPRR